MVILDMVNDAQEWLDSPATNFGWIILGDESSSRTAKRFDSREITSEQNRPSLTIEYTPLVVIEGEGEGEGEGGSTGTGGAACYGSNIYNPSFSGLFSCDMLTILLAFSILAMKITTKRKNPGERNEY